MEDLIKEQWPESLQGYKEDLVEFDFNPQSGIYFLFKNDELIYIGMASDIYSRIFTHNRTRSFDKVCYFPITDDIEIVERQLIQHFRPKLNIADNPDNARKRQKTLPNKKPSKTKLPTVPQPAPKYKIKDLPEILSKAPEDMLERVLSTIPSIERDIIIKRHGLFNGQSYTQQQIGDEYNLTRQRIQQIQKKAERKIMHPLRITHLI